jgi:hypothetical protein
MMTRERGLMAIAALICLSAAACTPGYMKVDDLNKKEQGPSHCAARCSELGMEMGALVLVSNQLPGCVCQPRGMSMQTAQGGASVATGGWGVILAAAAAARQQQIQQQQQQQQHSYHH